MSNTTLCSTISLSGNMNGDGYIYHHFDRTFLSNRSVNEYLRSRKQDNITNTLHELETANKRDETIEDEMR